LTCRDWSKPRKLTTACNACPPSHLLQKALPAKAVSNGSCKPAADSMVVISLPKSAREKKRMQ